MVVYYLVRGELEFSLRRLEIADDGDFSDDWPDGFFHEREDEFVLMYREFAIDPVLLTDNYDRACKLLDVGWHKGKLIGCMPDDWAKQVIKRLKLREMERKRIVHQAHARKKGFHCESINTRAGYHLVQCGTG